MKVLPCDRTKIDDIRSPSLDKLKRDRVSLKLRGAIAQLVEHLHGMQGVSGSNPLGSI
jgi:hypothetical protein